MKLNLAKSFVVAAGLTAIAFAAPAKAALVITEVMSSSSHPGGTSNADWFELTNTGGSAFSLTGFSWDDNTETPGSAHFGSISSIAAGASVVITGETVGAEAAFRSDWGIDPSVQLVNLGSTEFQSLSSTSDEVNIYNASNTLVTSVTLGAA
ncbi:MAG TPA: lamin tail domain-containing protein, partial [Tepidisphaeraceae bacterium]|nr:lamin tail domain-containing protein [Tepidisphaeraceae bacterium]